MADSEAQAAAASMTEEEKKAKQKAKKTAKAAEKAAKAAKKAANQAARGGGPVDAGPPIAMHTLGDEGTPAHGNFARITSEGKTGRVFTQVGDLNAGLVGANVWIRCRLFKTRAQGKSMCFTVMRQNFYTVQCTVIEADAVSRDMVKFSQSITPESIVDVFGEVVKAEVAACTQANVEIAVRKLYVVSKSNPLPITIEDLARSKAEATAKTLPFIEQDTRLSNRMLDLRTPANQAIFRTQSAVGQLFREALLGEGFTEIHSPKIIAGASEGGADVFTTSYFGNPACLAQSPQLYKQMGVNADLERVFEVGPVFRAEKSATHRHLCEFTGLDMEMSFKDHYHEVLAVLDKTFRYMFDGLRDKFAPLLKAVNEQYPYEPLQYLSPTLVLQYPEGIAMLNADGVEIGLYDDFNTAQEIRLGQLVKEKYKTDFYILDKFPLAIRPFYTMPDPNMEGYSNSYDIFLRGEEIMSGAQRIHEPEFLAERAISKGLDPEALKDYFNAFSYGAFPHAGGGVGLERVVMLYLGLNNIRKSSLFPRDPNRMTP